MKQKKCCVVKSRTYVEDYVGASHEHPIWRSYAWLLLTHRELRSGPEARKILFITSCSRSSTQQTKFLIKLRAEESASFKQVGISRTFIYTHPVWMQWVVVSIMINLSIIMLCPQIRSSRYATPKKMPQYLSHMDPKRHPSNYNHSIHYNNRNSNISSPPPTLYICPQWRHHVHDLSLWRCYHKDECSYPNTCQYWEHHHHHDLCRPSHTQELIYMPS